MNLAAQYAKALFETERPKPTDTRAALERRGHVKLAPRIYAEYQKLLVAKERKETYARVTPERERVRVLLELYRRLIA